MSKANRIALFFLLLIAASPGMAEENQSSYTDQSGKIRFDRVMRDVRSESPSDAQSAINFVFSYGVKAIPEIFNYLEKDSPGYPKRDSLASSFLKSFGPGAEPFLVKALASGPRLSRLIAIQTLDDIAYHQLLPAEKVKGDRTFGNGKDAWVLGKTIKESALDACEDTELQVKLAAIKFCSRLGYKSASRSAEKLVQDKSLEPFQRGEMLSAMLLFEEIDAGTALFYCSDFLESEKEYSVFVYADLGRTQKEEAFRLLKLLYDRCSLRDGENANRTRISTLSAMASNFPGHKAEVLERARIMLKSTDALVRYNASRLIGVAGRTDCVSEVIQLTRSTDPDVAKGAILGLASCPGEAAFQTLLSFVSVPVPTWYSIQAFGDLGDKRAIPVLEELATSKDSDVSRSAESALKKLKG